MKTAIAILGLLATGAVAWAQAPASDDQTPDASMLTLKTEARNVVVDVVATDKHGQPVTTLDKSQFKVFENGVEQQIVFFERHREGQGATQPAASGTAAAAAALPPGTFTNVPSAPTDGPLLVLLLDTLNTRVQYESYVRSQVLEYLKKIPPGTHMAIFTLGDDLRMIQGFTSDPAVLRAALDGRAYPATRPISFETMVAGTRGSLSQFANESDDLGNDLRIRYTVDALTALGNYLSAIPGRKSLIWMAGSIPWSINPDFSLVTTVTGRGDYADDVKKVADLMTLGRISIYPVDARALVTPPGYGADRSPGLSASNVVANRGGTGRESGSSFANRELASQMNLGASHMTMSNLAAATGGRAFYNTNGLSGAVDKVQSIGENYYTLVYSPTDKRYDGGMRKIDVQVTGGAAARLDYRRGYFSFDPAKAVQASSLASSSPLRAAMLRGAPDSTGIHFTVTAEVAPEQPANPADRIGDHPAALNGMAVTRYDFHWIVDTSAIRFTTSAEGLHAGEVDATLAAYDANGKILNSIFARLPLSLNDAQFAEMRKAGLPMKLSLDLPPGLVYLRTGVYDPATLRTGSTEFPISTRLDSPGQQKPAANASGRM